MIRDLQPVRDPRELDAIIVGHMHADHYLDLVGLRYLSRGAGQRPARCRSTCRRAAGARLDALASAISERAGLLRRTRSRSANTTPTERIEIGDLTVDFLPGRHYVPAWGCAIRDRAGGFIVVSGDTGPTRRWSRRRRGADLFVVEATLLSAGEDDPSAAT